MKEYIVEGVPLRDPLGQWFVDYTRSDLSGDTARAIVGTQPYGYHGDPSPREGFFSPSQENIVLNLVGSSPTDFASLLRGFQSLFGRPLISVQSAPQGAGLGNGSNRAQQTFSGPSSDVREALGRKIGSVAVERVGNSAARLTLIWENLWAFWRSKDSYTSTSVPLTTSPQDVDIATTAGASGAPISGALFRVKGPLTLGGYVLLRDRDTARSIRYNAVTALLATEYVIIDGSTLKAYKVATDTWDTSGGTDVSNRIEAGGIMYLTPGSVVSFPGGNAWFVRVNASGFSSGSTALEVRLRRSYLS